MLACQNLKFAYGTQQILCDINLRIKPAQIVGLVGPNGSGKSTLLRCLAGYLRPLGKIYYGSSLMTNLSHRQRAAFRAYVPQTLPEHVSYGVGDMMAMGRAHKNTFYQTQVALSEAAVNEFELHNLLDKPFDALSGGERQWVMLARALVQDPPLYLLDEPFAALDYRKRYTAEELLQKRVRQGASIVISMHDLQIARRLCHQLIVLQEGEIVAVGAPEKIITQALIERVYRVPLEFIGRV
jgi:iron complex transport system ATP-binding protein